jgi:hypothetical protein
MKVYLAGEFGSDTQRHMKRRLFSYWYHHDGDRPSKEVIVADEKYKLDLFLDSGAFTAFTKGVDIRIEDYGAYVRNVQHRFTVCASLDMIGDAAKSYDNLKALESMGCKVAPVFHAREDVRWLVKYLDEGYDYILIGGMVPESTPWLRSWLDHLFTKYLSLPDGTARVMLHGFGLTDQELMFRYPFFSVDSTSWLSGRFGGCSLMMTDGLGRPVLRKIVFSDSSPLLKEKDSWHYQRLAPPLQQAVDAALVRFGTTATECASHYSFRHKVNAQTFQQMESLAKPIFTHQEVGLFD